MATIELSSENFEEVISGNDIVIVDFWAPWCAPCRSFAPTFEAVSEKYPEVVFAKLNTEDVQDVAAFFGIRSIPTLMAFREKIILYSEAGALPAAALDSLVEQVKGVEMAEVHAEIARQKEAGA